MIDRVVLAALMLSVACGAGHPPPGPTPPSTPAPPSTPSPPQAPSRACPSFDPNRTTHQCGTTRWSIKTGADPDASHVARAPILTTIADLIALPAPSSRPESSRIAPVELTTYELRNVTLELAQLELDSDYHLAVNDGVHSMITEAPFPGCVPSTSVFAADIACARGQVDVHLEVTSFPLRPNVEVTIVGIGFFDEIRSFGAPNGIELHPILGICFGHDCDPLR